MPESCRRAIDRSLTDVPGAYVLLNACARDDKDAADYIRTLVKHLEQSSVVGLEAESQTIVDALGSRKSWLTAMIERDMAWLKVWQGQPDAAMAQLERACLALGDQPMMFPDRHHPCGLLPMSTNDNSNAIRAGYGAIISWCDSERQDKCGRPSLYNAEVSAPYDRKVGTFRIVESLIVRGRIP